MNIELTKEQYEYLMKLVYMGNWMASANYFEEKSGHKGEYDALESHIYSYAKQAGLEKYVDYDEDSKEYMPGLALREDEELSQYIGEYDNEIFWDELVTRLAQRDLVKQIGKEAFKKLENQERWEKLEPLIDKYEKEFMKKGIERLNLNQE